MEGISPWGKDQTRQSTESFLGGKRVWEQVWGRRPIPRAGSLMTNEELSQAVGDRRSRKEASVQDDRRAHPIRRTRVAERLDFKCARFPCSCSSGLTVRDVSAVRKPTSDPVTELQRQSQRLNPFP
jgi:hypothetical protein